jgi:hypothetical protein
MINVMITQVRVALYTTQTTSGKSFRSTFQGSEKSASKRLSGRFVQPSKITSKSVSITRFEKCFEKLTPVACSDFGENRENTSGRCLCKMRRFDYNYKTHSETLNILKTTTHPEPC